MTTLGAYVLLTKPRLLPLVLLSGLPALLLAAGRWPEPTLTVATLTGIAIAAGAANALNSYLERDRDARMERTRKRPLPAGALAPSHALAFGLVLGVIGTGLLWVAAGWVAAGLALAAILIYVFAYTLWLKPRHPVAVSVGGLSGAVAPLIADAAVQGTVTRTGLLLFAIIFVWQLPHFWAIALYRRREYELAGFRVLPTLRGDEATRRRILAWVAGLVVLGVLPSWLSPLGPLYAVAALLLGGCFLWQALQLYRRRTDFEARRLFRVSLYYLSGLFSVMLLDLVAFGVAP